MALVLVLSIIMVLGAFGYILSKLSAGARREVDVLGGHFRALSVADAAYAEVISRLSSTGWENRWFKGAPEVRSNVQAAGGSFSYVLRDVPGQPEAAPLPGLSNDLRPGQADLVVKATHGKSEALAVWRLMVPQDGLDEASRVVPAVFAHVPESAGGVTAAPTDPITTLVDDAVRKRVGNWSDFERKRPRLRSAQSPADVATTLGVPVPADALSEPMDETGRAPRVSNYPGAVQAGWAPPPPPPATAPWNQAPWRRWRNGQGASPFGSRTGISDRSQRGSDSERDAWDGWPRWPSGGLSWSNNRRGWDRDSLSFGGFTSRGMGQRGDDDEYDDDRYSGDGFGDRGDDRGRDN